MLFSSTLAVAAFAGAAAAAVHRVLVGRNGLRFSPDSIKAVAGDTVEYHFYGKHNVNQAAFSSPCQPLKDGFYSGLIDGGVKGYKDKFVVTIKDDKPIYFYCGYQRHCQNGMVGGINVPTTGDTLQAFAANGNKVQNANYPNGNSGGVFVASNDNNNSTASMASGSATDSAMASMTGNATASMTGSATGSATASSTSHAAGATLHTTATGSSLLIAAVGLFAGFLL